jgi:hypothetical protein
MTDTQPQEAQTYQAIGELSPTAEPLLTAQKTWDGLNGNPPPVEQPIDQLQGKNFSSWNKRANRQGLATTDDTSYVEDFFAPQNAPTDIAPIAGYSIDQGYRQTPTAATDPAPFDQFDTGVIDGADASTETSGNRGTFQDR